MNIVEITSQDLTSQKIRKEPFKEKIDERQQELSIIHHLFVVISEPDLEDSLVKRNLEIIQAEHQLVVYQKNKLIKKLEAKLEHITMENIVLIKEIKQLREQSNFHLSVDVHYGPRQKYWRYPIKINTNQ